MPLNTTIGTPAQGIIRQRQHVELATNVSLTVAQGLQTLLSLPVVTGSPSSRLLIWFSGCTSSAIAGANVLFIIFVDGVEFQSSNVACDVAGQGRCVAIIDDGPASFTTGSHVIVVKWQTLAQTAQIRPATTNEHASLTVLESVT